MKKIILIVISLLLTACSYNNTNENTENRTTNIGTEAGATEITSPYDNEETTSTLPEGMAYQLEDGTYISIDSLISPMNKLNNICQGLSDSLDFSGIYPPDVANKLAEYNNSKDTTAYAEYMFKTYVEMYGEDFSMQNEYISCSPLTDNELDNMAEFYAEYFLTNMTPKYGFIVKSAFKVTYKDEAGNAQEDTATDYYIAYSFNDVIYIDYFYVDTIDL